jgi:ABC-2 type transport system permease protein
MRKTMTDFITKLTNHPIFFMMKKEFIEIRRGDMLRLLLIAPIIQVLIFGYVATTDIKHVKTIICDEDGTTESRQLADKFLNSEYFDIQAYLYDPQQINEYFRKNKAVIAVHIPVKFSRNIKKSVEADVQLIVDGSDSNMSVISMNRAAAIIQGYSNSIFGQKLKIMKNVIGPLPDIAMQERVMFNPELNSANTMVPGVVGLILMVVTLIVTAVSIVREKENGNIEQLVVTPIKPSEIIFGKIIPYVLIALVDIVLITALSMIVFRISFAGSFTLLMSLSLLMILANLGLGIYVSTVSSTQQQAMLTAMFFMFPNMLLSGFIFPIKNMPVVLQWITYAIPLRYYMVIIRGIFLKGLTFMELLPQVIALLIFGVVIFTIAIKAFRKTVG